MTISGHLYETARGCLEIARQRMVDRYPFHAALLADSRFECALYAKTMAVTLRGGKVTILFNPTFVLECSWDELGGVLHHEVNHVIFGHLHQDPDDFSDAQSLVVAQEVTVNEFVREPLPGSPVTLEQYPALPPGESTVQRYRRLTADLSRNAASRKNLGLRLQNGDYFPRKTGQQGPKNVNSRPNIRPNQSENSSPEPNNSLQPLDDHEIWEEVRQQGAFGKLCTDAALKAARRSLPSNHWEAVDARLREAIDQTTAMDTTRSGREELEGYAGNGTVRWQVLLHRFTGEAVGKHESYGRPPRRFPQLVGIVPGSAQDPTKPVVLGVIDTSGSLSNRDLQLIAAELEKLAGLYKVIVVQCDARIRDVSPHRGRIKQICGRGSTDLRPPLTRRFLQRHRADVVVYFTDGFGPAPKRRPVRPVIWCLAAGGQRPAPYGRAVWMHHGI